MIDFLLENINHELCSFEIYEVVAFHHRFLGCRALIDQLAHKGYRPTVDRGEFGVHQAAVFVQFCQHHRLLVVIAPHLLRIDHRFDLFDIIHFFEFWFCMIFDFPQSYFGSACAIIHTWLSGVKFGLEGGYVEFVFVVGYFWFERILSNYWLQGFLLVVWDLLLWSSTMWLYLNFFRLEIEELWFHRTIGKHFRLLNLLPFIDFYSELTLDFLRSLRLTLHLLPYSDILSNKTLHFVAWSLGDALNFWFLGTRVHAGWKV